MEEAEGQNHALTEEIRILVTQYRTVSYELSTAVYGPVYGPVYGSVLIPYDMEQVSYELSAAVREVQSRNESMGAELELTQSSLQKVRIRNRIRFRIRNRILTRISLL